MIFKQKCQVETFNAYFPEDKKLPKLKFLKAQDTLKNSESIDTPKSTSDRDTYFDNDYARVEMLKLKPKPTLLEMFKKKTTLDESKFIYGKPADQSNQNKHEQAFHRENFEPNFNQTFNQSFNHTFNLKSQKDQNVRPSGWKGWPSAECNY